jgi:hypothetical protein
MNDTEVFASTQYNDYHGNIAVDKADLKELFSGIAKNKNIDLNKYFPIAMYFQEFENWQGVVFDVIKMEGTVFDVASNLNSNDELEITRFSFDMDIQEIFKLTKNFEFVLVGKQELLHQKINIKERIEL